MSFFIELTIDPDVSKTLVPDNSVDYYVEVTYGSFTDLTTGIEDFPPYGVDVSFPVLPRTDYVIQTTGSPLPTDPAIMVVYEV